MPVFRRLSEKMKENLTIDKLKDKIERWVTIPKDYISKGPPVAERATNYVGETEVSHWVQPNSITNIVPWAYAAQSVPQTYSATLSGMNMDGSQAWSQAHWQAPQQDEQAYEPMIAGGDLADHWAGPDMGFLSLAMPIRDPFYRRS